MRKYQPIWEAIKSTGQAALSAPPEIHNRIRNAVREEKKKDLQWREDIKKRNLAMQLNTKSDGALLYFKLVEIPHHKSHVTIKRIV